MDWDGTERVNKAGALRLLADGGEINAEVLDLLAGPVQIPVHSFTDGQLVIAALMHQLLMDGCVDFEHRGADPNDPATWWYVITASGLAVVEGLRAEAGGARLATN